MVIFGGATTQIDLIVPRNLCAKCGAFSFFFHHTPPLQDHTQGDQVGIEVKTECSPQTLNTLRCHIHCNITAHKA